MAEKELKGQERQDGTSNTSNFLKATAASVRQRRRYCSTATTSEGTPLPPPRSQPTPGASHAAWRGPSLAVRPQAPALLPRSPRKYITFSETTGGRVAAPGMTYEVS